MRFSNIIMIKLDRFFRMIHRYIDLAMSLKKNCARLSPRTIFFKTHSSTNISVYHAQSIQFYINISHQRDYCVFSFRSKQEISSPLPTGIQTRSSLVRFLALIRWTSRLFLPMPALQLVSRTIQSTRNYTGQIMTTTE